MELFVLTIAFIYSFRYPVSCIVWLLSEASAFWLVEIFISLQRLFSHYLLILSSVAQRSVLPWSCWPGIIVRWSQATRFSALATPCRRLKLFQSIFMCLEQTSRRGLRHTHTGWQQGSLRTPKTQIKAGYVSTLCGVYMPYSVLYIWPFCILTYVVVRCCFWMSAMTFHTQLWEFHNLQTEGCEWMKANVDV